MMHDVIAETFPKLTVPRLSARVFWNAKVALGRMQADALITVSEYSRECILKRFGGDRSRIHVVGEAADPIFRKLEFPAPTARLKELGLDGTRRLAVYLGGFSPHKNLIALVNAFREVAGQPEFSDLILAMVGDTSGDAFHTYFGEVAAHVEALGLLDRAVFTGFLKDEDVAALLNLARVLLLPSLMEGFGLPALEAAACGCPVIATKRVRWRVVGRRRNLHRTGGRGDCARAGVRAVVGGNAAEDGRRGSEGGAAAHVGPCRAAVEGGDSCMKGL